MRSKKMKQQNKMNTILIQQTRKNQKETAELGDVDDVQEDDFDKIYKGEISKSGAAILPSKRVRRMPEKITAIKDDEAKEDIQQTENETTSADNKTK